MPSSNEIRNIQFSASKNGYSRDEVDVFLDAVEEDYKKFEAESARLRSTVANLTKELEETKESQSSIQTVLVRAQKLADEIIEGAKAEADNIINESKSKTDVAEQKAKDAIIEIENEAAANKKAAEAEIEKMKSDALKTSEAIITSAKDSVARQQIQFDAIRAEVAQFKEQIKNLYKEHIELLSKIPEEVSGSPIEAASAVEKILSDARAAAEAETADEVVADDTAEPQEEVPAEETEPQTKENSVEETAEEFAEAEAEKEVSEEVSQNETEETADETDEPVPVSDSGFKITFPDDIADDEAEEENTLSLDDDDDEEDEKHGFGSSFFRRKG